MGRATYRYGATRIEDYTPNVDRQSGDVVVLPDDRGGVVAADVLADDIGSVYADGIFDMPSASGTTATDGELAYFDVDDSLKIIPAGLADVSTDIACGTFAADKVSGALVATINLNDASIDKILGAVPAGGGGLFGAKTIVVSTAGDDVLGAAHPYANEFLTIQAAITAATSGDCVIVRPGSYAEAVGLKTGVRLHGLPGAKITKATTDYCIGDNGSAVSNCPVTGSFQILPTGGAMGVALTAASVCAIEAESLVVTGSGLGAYVNNGGTLVARFSSRFASDSGTSIVSSAGSTVTVEADKITNATGAALASNSAGAGTIVLRARQIDAGTGKAVSIAGDVGTIDVKAAQSITGAQILVDSGSTGATRVSIKAPTITATNSGDYGANLAGSGAARYDISADVLTCAIKANAASGEVHVCAGWHGSQATGVAPISAYAGRTFTSTEESQGIAGDATLNAYGAAAELHVLRGRIIGDAGAAGAAVQILNGTAKVVLYPGAALIAGAAAANSIAIFGVITPTVVAMGAIAANKAADVAVTIAVGSLLVDASVA